VAAQSEYSRRSSRWTLPRAWHTQHVKIPGVSGGAGGTVQLIFVDWVALEGAHARGGGDRRFEDQLSAAAGPEASAAHWQGGTLTLVPPFSCLTRAPWKVYQRDIL